MKIIFSSRTIWLSVIIVFALAIQLQSQTTGIAFPGMSAYDSIIPQVMQRWGAPAVVIAVVKDGRLVLVRGYGKSNTQIGSSVRPDALFRIASISKPVTAIAILRLIEEGKLSLNDKAFSILEIQAPAGATVDPKLFTITIRNLLEHEGGWNSAWSGDPMFESIIISQKMGVAPPPDTETIIRYMMGKKLDFTPGTRYAYSNFGYCVLGRIIEKITGQSYQDYVRSLLKKVHIEKMQIGKTLEKATDEVVYYDYYGAEQTPSVFDPSHNVSWPYGGFYLEAMDSHGGWISSAIDLMRLVTAVDGRSKRPRLLKTATITEMIATPNAYEGDAIYYAKGWQIRPIDNDANWWHIGSLPGTSAVVVRSSYKEMSWVALSNYRAANPDGLAGALDNAMWQAAYQITSFPSYDLFAPLLIAPADSAAIDSTEMTFSWSAVAGATKYHLQISESENFTSFVINDSTLRSPSIRLKVEVDKNCYWRVRANYNDQFVEWSTANFLRAVKANQRISIPLNSGWNLISWNVDTANDSTEVLLNAIKTKVIVALGYESGGQTYDPKLPNLSSLPFMDHLHGYWINMSSPDTLILAGTKIDPAVTPIPCETGWNLVSYLYTQSDSISHGFSPVINYMITALGYKGVGQTFVPQLRSFSTLNVLSPYLGYWLRLNHAANLLYPQPLAGIDPAIGLVPILARTSREDTHSLDGFINPSTEWISLYGQDIIHQGKLLAVGTEVKAKDQDGIECGSFIVRQKGVFGFIPVYRDDPNTDIDEGARPGEEINLFFANDKIPVNLKWTVMGDVIDVATHLTGVGRIEDQQPDKYALSQNYPNPFNPLTTINYKLPNNAPVTLKVYNMLGEEIISLLNQDMTAGQHQIIWDGRDFSGKMAPSGLYFYTIKSKEFEETKRMLLLY